MRRCKMKRNRNLFLVLLVIFLLCIGGCNELDSVTASKNEIYDGKYIATFVTNGGTAVGNKRIDVIQASPITTKAGYDFCGWYYDSNLTAKVEFPVMLNSNFTFYAKWEKITYNVDFITNGGSAVQRTKTDKIYSSPITNKVGYDFCGWYYDSKLTQKVKFPLLLKSDLTLYAKWEKTPHIVKFVTNGGTVVTNVNTSELEFSPMTSKKGYTFVGWYSDSGYTKKVSFPLSINAPTTLYAKWLRTEASTLCRSSEIKFNRVSYDITPPEFDFYDMSQLGYDMKITVTYHVYYEKDYDVWLDLGYLGSPKYEVSIHNSKEKGKYYEDLGTTKYGDTRSISMRYDAKDLIGDRILLDFSTNNIQNVIYLENISIKYECVK